MPLNPDQEEFMQKSLLIARLIWLFLCFVAPLTIIIIYYFQVLHGDVAGFLTGFGMVPWKNSIIFLILLMSLITAIATVILPEIFSKNIKFKYRSIFNRLIVRHSITCSFIDLFAIYGLVLGNTLGPNLASLSLVFMSVPMIVGCIIFPNQNDWRYLFELEHEHS